MIAGIGCIMETMAKYTEPKIRTYGFETRYDLCLCEFTLDLSRISLSDLKWYDGDSQGVPFEVVFTAFSDERTCRLSLVLPNGRHSAVLEYMQHVYPQNAAMDTRLTAPVELLYFFGPHFADRFGIADYTFEALARCDIPLIAAACSGSSIFLILPENCARKAKAAFSKLFEVPSRLPDNRRYAPLHPRQAYPGE